VARFLHRQHRRHSRERALETGRYIFGCFDLDAREGVLRRDGRPLHLAPKSLEVLVTLVERHGELVDKGRIFEQVWPGVTVEDCNLAQHVASLRRALGDDAREPSFIETVSRRGYRFVADVIRGAAHGSAEVAQLPRAEPAPAAAAAQPRDPEPRVRLARVAGLGLALAALSASAAWATFRGREVTWRVALLPVANLTGDPRNAHLAALLGDALHADLSSVRGLRLEQLRPAPLEHDADIAPPGKRHAAQVDAIVETAVLSAGDRVQVAVELIEASTDALIWADILEADHSGLRGLESRMEEVVLSRLQLNRAERLRPATGRAAARREMALASYYWSHRSPHSADEYLEHYSTAVELDPVSAQAHAALAQGYLQAAEQRAVDPREALRRAEAAALRALQLQPSLADAHLVAAGLAEARSDLAGALDQYQQVLLLDHGLAKAHERYSRLLGVLGRHPEAVAEARRALDLEPGGLGPSLALAGALLMSGRLEEAIAQASATLHSYPHAAEAHDVIGRAHQAAGRRPEAAASFAEAHRLSGGSPLYLSRLARVRAVEGRLPEARRLLEELERTEPAWRLSALDLAPVLAALGEPERAHHLLEREAEEGGAWLVFHLAGLRVPELDREGRLYRLLDRVRAQAEQLGRVAALAEAGVALPAAR
jgi:DNA-binding winged helix-turn-helix (wHTH) protein/tetratricopeptide (TPR) repeat protein/TolB-like protein